METSLADAFKEAIMARRSTLGHVDLASQWAIRKSQIVASLHKVLGRQDASPVIRYNYACEDEPECPRRSLGHQRQHGLDAR